MSWREDKAVAIAVARLKGYRIHGLNDEVTSKQAFRLSYRGDDGGLRIQTLMTCTTWADVRDHVCNKLEPV